MTKEQMSKMTGAQLLRLIVNNLDACAENFLDRFTADQLIQIGRMHLLSEFDFYPDQWTDRQIREALIGKVPQWTANETPKYETRSRVTLGADERRDRKRRAG